MQKVDFDYEAGKLKTFDSIIIIERKNKSTASKINMTPKTDTYKTGIINFHFLLIQKEMQF